MISATRPKQLVLLAIIATIVGTVGHAETWVYYENVNEISDTSNPYLITSSDRVDGIVDARLGIGMLCSDEDRLFLLADSAYVLDSALDPLTLLRFDKARAIDTTAEWSDRKDAIMFNYDGMRDLMLAHAVLRLQARFVDQGIALLKFDLLDFNRAFAECPVAES